MALSERYLGPGSVAIALLLFKGDPAQAAPPAAPDDARGSLAVYCLERCGEVALPTFKLKRRLPRAANTAVYSVERYGTEFGIPDPETLSTWGVGDVRELPQAKAVVVIRWAGPTEGSAERVVTVARAATAAGRWVEDLDSGRIYGPDAFAAALDGFSGPADVTGLMVVDGGAAGEDQSVRLVTRGLRKVGLPDLVVENVPGEREDELSVVLNGVAQALYELDRPGVVPPTVRVDARDMASRRAAEGLCDAQGVARLRLTTPRRDDPPGPLADVDWEGVLGDCGGPAPPPSVAPLARPPGPLRVSPPSTAPTGPAAPPTPNQSDLQRARAAAMTAIDGPIRHRFAAGAAGTLMVKAPFSTSAGGVEWLWMTVERWDDDDVLIGRMANQPADVPGLQKGARVSARVPQLFDYVWTSPDGTVEGNQTAPFLE